MTTEKYVPTPEDYEKAESVMSEPQQQLTEAREEGFAVAQQESQEEKTEKIEAVRTELAEQQPAKKEFPQDLKGDLGGLYKSLLMIDSDKKDLTNEMGALQRRIDSLKDKVNGIGDQDLKSKAISALSQVERLYEIGMEDKLVKKSFVVFGSSKNRERFSQQKAYVKDLLEKFLPEN